MEFISSINRLASWKMHNNNNNNNNTTTTRTTIAEEINNGGEEDTKDSGQESIGVEEYAALPTFLPPTDGDGVKRVAPCRSGSTLHQRRFDLYERLTETASDCSRRYGGGKELATESDEDVVELCKLLEEVFQYGLIQQDVKFVASAAKLFQNMHQIVSSAAAGAGIAGTFGIGSSSSSGVGGGITFTDNDSCFWDFCRKHLNASDCKRFESLQKVQTKLGRGKAFIRAALNEQSLAHHLSVWRSKPELLHLHYSHWSLLADDWMSANLLALFKCLDNVLFALDVDKAELDVYTKYTLSEKHKKYKEPVIYAPEPIHIETKRPVTVVERPITTAVSNRNKDNVGGERVDSFSSSSGGNVISVEMFRTAVERLLPTGTTCEKDICLPHSIDDYLEDCYGSSLGRTEQSKDIHESNSSSLDDEEEEGSSKTPSLIVTTTTTTTEAAEEASPTTTTNPPPICTDIQHLKLQRDLIEAHEKCNLLETRVAQLSLENCQLIRRLKQYFGESGIDPSSSFATNFLITIPRCKLQGGGGGEKSSGGGGVGTHYIYEIHITMRQNLEHWSLWRRYSDFYKLHQGLLRTHPTISAVSFPPKKRFGNLEPQFVDERRQQLQIYLLNLVEMLPQLEACRTRAELQKVFPFLKPR